MSRVEGTMSRVEGNDLFLFFLKNGKQMENKWKTNDAWTSPSILVLLVGWGGGGNMLLDNRFLNMSDCLGTSSLLC